MKEMMTAVIIGYLLGSINPAALVSRIKRVNMRERGTGNLGATNTMLLFGKGFGAAVMLFDIAKGAVSVILAGVLFPHITYIGLLAGLAAVIGHIFPFYMKFKGGKGLAAYAGMILAFDPLIFLLLLILCVISMLIVNYSVAMPMTAAVLFPVCVWIFHGDIILTVLSVAASALIAFMHRGNITKAKNGTDNKVRDYIRKYIFK